MTKCPDCNSKNNGWYMHKMYYVPIKVCTECGKFFNLPKNDVYKKNPEDNRDPNEVE